MKVGLKRISPPRPDSPV